MQRRHRRRPKRSRIFLVMLVLPLAALGAALFDWTLGAGLFAGAWVLGVMYCIGDMFATDRKYGTWGSDHTPSP